MSCFDRSSVPGAVVSGTISWAVLLPAPARPAPSEKGHFVCRMRQNILLLLPPGARYFAEMTRTHLASHGRLSPCRQYSDPLHGVLSFSFVSRRYCLRCVISVARTVIMLQFACKTRKHHSHFATFSHEIDNRLD